MEDHLIVLGAGPSALEVAASYVTATNIPRISLLEKDSTLCGGILNSWPNVRMFSTMEHNMTELGMQLIGGDAKFDLAEAPTGKEFVEGYCNKLAEALLSTGRVFFHYDTTVISLSRTTNGGKAILCSSRETQSFRILAVNTKSPEQEIEFFGTTVVDCTGIVYDGPMGAGGSHALGEKNLQATLRRNIALPNENSHCGKDIVVIGSGYSAATTVINLLEAESGPPRSLKWLTRRDIIPIYDVIADDVLPLRKALCKKANEIISDGGIVTHMGGATITKINKTSEYKDRLRSELVLGDSTVVPFDIIFCHVGGRPDTAISRELQIHTCYATEGPMKLAASLMGGSGDCMAQLSAGVETLKTTEPGFWVCGSKSYGRKGGYLHKIGGQQAKEIAEAF